ncbi:hypothetical protein AVEN_97572-1 [Araneus ventricosus]|uniref:Uncharacterized protein n=1 Tax=Araneus ventricosus TaxID=182803 RepID=A0A4Y2F7K9_ARAVE|nr:hypothetical protein AVEN_97572-1 [Araneus ventricosus]
MGRSAPHKLQTHPLVLRQSPTALISPPPSKREFQPAPISSSHAATPVAFQHLWSGIRSPNEALGYPDKLDIQTFESTVPILIDF